MECLKLDTGVTESLRESLVFTASLLQCLHLTDLKSRLAEVVKIVLACSINFGFQLLLRTLQGEDDFDLQVLRDKIAF